LGFERSVCEDFVAFSLMFQFCGGFAQQFEAISAEFDEFFEIVGERYHVATVE
jgi:hypothetical protein